MNKRAWRNRLSALLLAALGAMALSAFGASSANADTMYTYCTGFATASYGTCKGPRHSISRNEVDGDTYAPYCAGAFLNGSFYGSYVCNSGGARAQTTDGIGGKS